MYIHSGVRRSEIQTTTAPHDIPNHLAQCMVHCGYNIFLVKTLCSQWHVVRYELLHGTFVRKQHFLPLSESPMVMTSGKVQSFFLLHWCLVFLSCWPVGLQKLFGECLTSCLIERSFLGVVIPWMTRPFHVKDHAICIEFDDSRHGAMQFSSNVYPSLCKITICAL